jgi:hypothetical protein
LAESWSAKVCVGGRKKKLKASMLPTATATAYGRPNEIATGSTAKM